MQTLNATLEPATAQHMPQMLHASPLKYTMLYRTTSHHSRLYTKSQLALSAYLIVSNNPPTPLATRLPFCSLSMQIMPSAILSTKHQQDRRSSRQASPARSDSSAPPTPQKDEDTLPSRATLQMPPPPTTALPTIYNPSPPETVQPSYAQTVAPNPDVPSLPADQDPSVQSDAVPTHPMPAPTKPVHSLKLDEIPLVVSTL